MSGKIEWYCGIQVFYHCQILPSFSFVCQVPINDFKVLTRFSQISFFPFIFQYVFRVTFTSIFLKSTVLLSIFLKLNFRKKSVVLFGPELSIFYFKNILFFVQKKRCFLKIAVPEFSTVLKSTFLLLAIFLKIFFIRKKKVVLFDPKLSIFYF